MRVLLAAGGTGGHINPAIAIADCIKKHDMGAEILFAGSPKGMEANLIPKAGYRFEPVEVYGFQRGLSFENIGLNLKAAKCLITASFKAKKIIRDFKPDIVIGTGGYVSGPVVRKAAHMRIKTAIHEQNAFPGVTNRMLSKDVDIVFAAFDEARKYFPNTKRLEVVGNPVRESIVFHTKEAARKELSIAKDEFCIFSFGGSLGAVKINEIGADIMKWHTSNPELKVRHIHGYGRLGKEVFPEMIRERDIDLDRYPNISVHEYIYNMDACLSAADIVLCRAGAITLSEIEATGKASILVPSPNVTANHQYHNAMVLVKNHAAILVEEKSYQKDDLIKTLNLLYSDREKLIDLGKNASKLAIIDTADRVYRSISAVI